MACFYLELINQIAKKPKDAEHRVTYLLRTIDSNNMSDGIGGTRKLAGRTLFITGASRGIGKAIALKAARDGANIVIAAKTAEPHPKLPGTIYTAAKESCALCS